MNLNEFKNLRLKEKYQFDHVRLWIDSEYDNPEPNEVVVPSNIPAHQFDARLFYGLPVFIYSENYNETVCNIFERLKGHTNFILVALTAFGDDLGWKWTKALGEQEI